MTPLSEGPNPGSLKKPAQNPAITPQRAWRFSTVSHPFGFGHAARTRFHLTVSPTPAEGDQLRLRLEPDAVQDLFGNNAEVAFESTFPWSDTGLAPQSAARATTRASGGDAPSFARRVSSRVVIYDAAPPEVVQILVRGGRLEVELSDTLEQAAIDPVFELDGVTGGWQPGATPYKWLSPALSVGSHELIIHEAALEATFQPTALVQQAATSLAARDAPVDRFYPFDLTNPDDAFFIERYPPDTQVAESTLGNRHGFHGRPTDPETGLVYFRNRYYDPQLGRFITADPLGYVDGPSQYHFARNNPSSFTDPLGLNSFDCGVEETCELEREAIAYVQEQAARRRASTTT